MKGFPLKLFFAVFFLSFFCHLNAENKLKVLRTKYFSIIYSKKSEASAALLYEHADSYAEEIASRLGRKPPHNLPVYLSLNSEDLNGYFTFFPYRRIVIYDISQQDGSLGNSADTILNTFYHELTHAISLFYYLPLLPLSFSEGAAVLFESRDGHGRLNDPLIYHHLMQNKIDGTSPSWRQAAGHRDVYPGAFWAYIYGAAFSEYLERIYGSETYSKLWHHDFFVFPKSKTKKIFEKSLDSLWNNFLNTIQFPQEFLTPEEYPSEMQKSGFCLLAGTEAGFAYFDFCRKEVRFQKTGGGKERLFTADNADCLNFSSGGSKLLVTDSVVKKGQVKKRLFIYDMQKKEVLSQQAFSVRYAAYCGSEICAVKVSSQFTTLELLDGGTLEKKETLFKAGPGLPYAQIYNPVYAGGKKIAFIAANGIKRDILIFDTITKKCEKLETSLPLNAIRYLQSSETDNGTVLTFSWAEKNMLYRMGMFNLKTGELHVLEKDISGGVFYPILIKKDNKIKAVYTGVHGKYNRLYMLNPELLSKKEGKFVSFDVKSAEIVTKVPKIEGLPAKNFYYSSWLWKVLPLPVVLSSNDFTDINKYGFGMLLWGQDPTELFQFHLTPAFFAKPFFQQVQFTGSVNTLPVKILVDLHDLNFDFRYRKTGFTIGAASSFPLINGKGVFYTGFNAGANWFAPFPKDLQNDKHVYNYKHKDTVLSCSGYGSYSYSRTLTSLGTNFFVHDKRGGSCSASFVQGYSVQDRMPLFALQAMGLFLVPVVPLKLTGACYYGFNTFFDPILGSYCPAQKPLPFLSDSYLPSMPEFGKSKQAAIENVGKHNFGIGFKINLTILSYEIQTGSSWLPIFYNRINLNLGYKGVLNIIQLKNKYSPSYLNSIYSSCVFEISGVAKIGLRYAQPLERKMQFGNFSLIFDVGFL